MGSLKPRFGINSRVRATKSRRHTLFTEKEDGEGCERRVITVGMREDDGRVVRRSSGHSNEPAIQVICLVSQFRKYPWFLVYPHRASGLGFGFTKRQHSL